MILEDLPKNPITVSIDVNKRRYQALMLTGIVLPILLYPFLSILLIPTGLDYTTRIFCSRLLIWVTFGLMLLYARYAEVQGFFLWPEQKYNTSFYVKSIVGLYVLAFAAGIVSSIPFYLGLHENNEVFIKLFKAMYKSPFLIFFGAITAGITEEFIFRGYILSRLSLFIKNKHAAVVISALLFAFIHLSYKTVHELLFAFLIGIIAGYHYQKYRNITVLVVVHFLVDVIAFMAHTPLHHK